MSDQHLTTAAGLDALAAELADLEGRGRRDIAGRIKTAREWGDLKENAEYHDAKNEQAHLETRIARLRDKMTRAVVVTDAPPDGVAGLGSAVTVRDESGREQMWTIVGSHEAAPSDGRLSVESPVGRALTGRRVGDTATIALPRGTSRLVILSVA